MDGRRVLLGVTGGVAAYKSAHLARLLVAAGADVTVVMTDAATRFVGPDTFAALTGNPVHTSLWERPGDVIHVRLAHDTDVAVVAPATANVLAKLAHGLADDLLTSTLLEYRGPLVIAPAMHTGMWEHPATQRNIETLDRLEGRASSGPRAGRSHTATAVRDASRSPRRSRRRWRPRSRVAADDRDLEGRTILVTAGPTYEPIDPVRFLGNRSSGKMGIAIAVEAAARGARVELILGPGTVARARGHRRSRGS